jgi:hypothetical protein
MTVPSETNRNAYVATALQTVFPYDFRILDETHISVYQNGILLTITTDYTVSNVGNGSGGNVTLVTGATVSDTITIVRSVPLTQETDYVENDAFPAETHEEALDKSTMQIQELKEKVDRSLKFSVDSTETDVAFPDPGSSGQVVAWTALGTLENVTNDAGTSATSVDETDTDTTKNKLTSNALAKRAEDTAQAVNGVQATSAVNQLQVTNSATGDPVLVEATGDDTNIDVKVDGKGAGDVHIGTTGTGDVILGPQVDMPFIGGNVLAQHTGLVIIRPTVATFDIDADDVILEDTDGRFYRASSVNLTATISSSHAFRVYVQGAGWSCLQ